MIFFQSCVQSEIFSDNYCFLQRRTVMVWCENMGIIVCRACLPHFELQPESSFFKAKSGTVYVRPFLMVLHIYWSRLAQFLLVAHHGHCDLATSPN